MIDPIARRTHDVFEQSTEGADERLGAWLRERDRLGALSETHAALDTAFSRGYAQGHEEALAERLDAARTVLLRMLETKFGEVCETALDRIETASLSTVERWMVALLSTSSVDETLRG